MQQPALRMTSPAPDGSLRPFVVIFVLLAALLTAGGYGLYRHEKFLIKEEKYNDFKAIGELKTNQIIAWRRERLSDARLHSSSPLFREAVSGLAADPANKRLTADLLANMRLLRDNYQYDNIALASPDGRVLLSLDSRLTVLEEETQNLVSLAAVSFGPAFGDFYPCPKCDEIHLDVAAPLLNENHQVQAVLVLRVNPEEFLYPLIQSWPLPSASAETLLIRKDGDRVVFLNPLRHRPDPPLSIRVPLSRADFPAARAAMGETGGYEGRDYRGVPVVAGIHQIPDSPWFMVAKMDAAEIYAGIREQAYFIGFFTLALVGMAGAGVGLLYKHQGKRTFQTLYHAERERAEAVEEFKTTLYSIGDAVITTDTKGNIRQMNPVAEKLTGWTEEDSRGRPVTTVFRIINETDGRPVENPVEKVIQKGLVVGLANHTLLIARDGRKTPIADSGAPIRDESGDITGVVLVFRDQFKERESQKLILTRLKLLEYAAAHSLEALLQKTLDEAGALTESPIGFYHFVERDQKTLSLQAWSTRTLKEFCKTEGKGLHYSLDEAGVWVDCVHARKPVVHNDYASLPHKRGLPEGHAQVVRELVVPILRADRVVAILGVGNKPADYTEKDIEIISYLADVAWEIAVRKKAEEALKAEKKNLRAIMAASPVGLLMFDENEDVTYMNPSAERMFQTELKKLAPKKCGNILGCVHFREHENGCGHSAHCPDCLFFKAVREAVRAGQGAFDQEAAVMRQTAGGQQQNWYGFSAAPVLLGGKRHAILAVSDITLRKQAEASLRESESRFRQMTSRQQAILSAVPDIIIEVDMHKTYTWANAAGLEFFGEDVIGREAAVYFEGDQDTYDAVQPLFNGKEDVIYVESWQRRKDGEKRLLAWWCKVLKDEKGNPSGGLSTARDITDQRALEAQLIQAQKMESVGRLAGGVAHDFNNMLSVILGYSELALEKIPPEDPLREDITEILSAGRRSADVTRQLLAFARRQTIAPKVLDLNETVEEMLKMLRRLIGEDIDLIWHPHPGLWPVKIDPAQIDQIMANLCVNARDAISGVGKITIETENTTLDADECAHRDELIPGDYVLLMVSDTGRGMDPATRERIFEPFFTTKGVGEGTGLGLSTIYGIVKQNKGDVQVYSEPGNGTTFRIYLPRHIGETHVVEDRGVPQTLLGRGETVLVAEDESAILKLTARMLQGLGYTVLTADGPKSAEQIAKSHPCPIDLLMTDVVMPEMSGRDLANRLKMLYPDLKVLYMSGYTANVIAHRGVLEENMRFIAKPFSQRDLAKKVREALE